MILVLGSTGRTGREVARQLIELGEATRLLVRNRTKAAEFEGRAQIFEGDLGNRETLHSALEGVDSAYLVSTGLETRELEKKFIDAAKQSGIRHIVKLSAIKADQPIYTIAEWHAEIEQHLMDSGIAWTMIRPGHFSSNALLFWSHTIKTQNVFYHPTDDGRWPSITPTDVAAVAVKALTDPDHRKRAYTVTGSESMNAAGYAAVLSNVLGRKIGFVDISAEAAGEGMRQSGMPPAYVEAVLDLLTVTRSGRLDIITETFEQLTDRKPTSFFDWAVTNRAAFE